jgi:hypothetical protein
MKQRFLNQKLGKRNSRRAEINKAVQQTAATTISEEKLRPTWCPEGSTDALQNLIAGVISQAQRLTYRPPS